MKPMSNNDEEIVFRPKTEQIYKLIVIGDPAVGKTSLLTKFASNKFENEYLPTVGVNIVKEMVNLKVQGGSTEVNLLIWDIAGQPQFYMLHKPYFNGADGMLLVFDITRSSSFSNMNNWYNTAVKYGLSGVPRILVGNKNDLKEERKIIAPMADHLSEKLNAPYFETSAITGQNVKLIFEKIAELLYHSKTKK
jgi:Ras-related protein Rab-1A